MCQLPPTCDPQDPSSCLPQCVEAGKGDAGESCRVDSDCLGGQRCAFVGFSVQCVPAGHLDLGASCAAQADCSQGLYCASGECSPPTPPLGVPSFSGVECAEPDDDNVAALFAIAGTSEAEKNTDFFALPFPNDIRLRDGKVDLTGFPTPGTGLIDQDLVKDYVAALERDATGWSTNPTVYFRFSGAIDLDSLARADGGPRRIVLTDVDDLPDDPESGIRSHGIQYAVGGRTNYVCDNWLALRVSSDTLVPGHRYVAYISRDLRSAAGESVARSAQFASLLDRNVPDDAQLAAAHSAYAPLRELIEFYQGSSFEIAADSILTAAVFTTQNVLSEMRELSGAVANAEQPQARGWTRCAAGVESPCEQAEDELGRACGQGTSDYDEYQALLSLPIFQEGEAPYLKEGGRIAAGVVRTQEVCLSVAVPKTAMPSEGWPLIIYGHGTGGGYRSALRQEVAGELASTSPSFVTASIDQVQHGPRRGDGEGSDQKPDNLFFNFTNPDAARGNPLQGAADLLSVLRWASSGTLAEESDTGDAAILIDSSSIFVFAHSQGATHASLALPFSGLKGAVLSGNGGGLVEALMTKKNPVDIASAMPFIIQDARSDGTLQMGDKHPVLSLLQHYIDPADPSNFAALLAERPEADASPLSLFMTFGLDDTYSPPLTLARFIHAAKGMQLAPAPEGLEPSLDNRLVLPQQTDPVSGNVTVESEEFTLACRQYESANSDGHFVVFDQPQANRDAIGFLSSLAAGELPRVPADSSR